MKSEYSLSKFLQEEMEAREWTEDDLNSRITDPVDQCAVFLAVYGDGVNFILDEHTAKVLGRIFDVNSQFFINLKRSE